MKNINTILFDFNGLVVDDEPIHFELFQKVLADEEIELTEEVYWKDYLGFDDKGLFGAIYERDGLKLTPKKLKYLIDKKNELYFPTLKKKLKLFDGVVEFIKKVSDKFNIAIVSGALKSEIVFVLEESDLKKYFSLIIAADDTKRGKPDPEGFLMALTKIKKDHPEVIPETCLVLEDSIAGIQAGKACGMKVIALTHTYPRNRLGEADVVCDRFLEVEELLGLN
jgi:HAD superfamily hydrolase (TIGR01509 family)